MIVALSGLGFCVLALIVAVLWQHNAWRRTERQLEATQNFQDSLRSTLDVAPDGYFGWFYVGDETAQPQCSRRLAVLLDLFAGLDATWEDVRDGFDPDSASLLEDALTNLKNNGQGFEIDLRHAPTGRHIRARGVRAVSEGGDPQADLVWMSDVTEGVAAVSGLSEETEQLRRHATLLTAALDGISWPIWVRDDDLSLIYCNRAYVSAVDGKKADEVVSRGRELAPKALVREVRALAAAARAALEPQSEAFHMVIEGSRRLMDVTETPVPDDVLLQVRATSEDPDMDAPSLFGDGTGRLTAGIAYDITRQEELQNLLKRESESQSDILERLGTAIAVFQSDTRLSFHNTAFEKLWQLDPLWLAEAPTYGDLLEALRRDRRLPEVADFPAFKEQELARFTSLLEPREDVLHLPEGETLRRVMAPHPSGGLLATYEDVTDKLAMEASYNTLIAVQRETIDNLQEAVVVFGADSRLKLANPAFLALWGQTAQDIMDQPVSRIVDSFESYFEAEAAWPTVRTALLKAADPADDRSLQTGRLERTDDKVLTYVAVPLPDGGVLMSYSDISTSAQVERTLRDRAETATATDKLKSEFISNVSDELYGPMSALGDLADVLAQAEDSANAITRSGISAIARQVIDLLEDVRQLARIEAGTQALQLDTFDIQETVTSAVSLTREAVKRHQVKFTWECADQAGWMVGDESRIKQALYHLLTGALKTADPGDSITFTARRVDEATSGFVEFEVTSPEKDLPTKADIGATGLGLFLAKRFIELHEGSVDVVSRNGVTQITCRLPTGS